MNWFKSDTTNTDSYISNTFYSGSSDTCGINLRLEMEKILKDPVCGKGHYVAYRRYDRTTTSEHFSKYTKEGKGGPAYIFKDEPLLTRRVPLSFKGQKVEYNKAGILDLNRFVYYFEFDTSPKRGDHIFELSLGTEEQKSIPILDELLYVERYVVVSTQPFRLHRGRIEYWSVIVEYDEIGY